MLNTTNNLNGNEMNADFNFLGTGIYDIVSVTKRDEKRGIEFLAEVRRWNNTHWINERINISFLFKANSVGPMLKYQPKSLIDHVINIKCTRNKSNTGKVFFKYVWEINNKLTEVIQEEMQQFDYDECEEQEFYYIEELENNSIAYDRQLVLEEQEQHLLEEQERQENIEEN